VTPGITAPDVSFTNPSMVLCAEAATGSSTRINRQEKMQEASLAFVILNPPYSELKHNDAR